MKKVIIIGNSDYARLIREYVDELDEYHCDGFSVDGAYISESKIDGLPVIAFEEIKSFFPVDSVKLILAIGYQKLGKTRRDLYSRYSELGYCFTNYIHPSAHVDKKCVMGNGNIFLESVIVQKRVKIGNGNVFFQDSMISHDDVVGNFNTFCGRSLLCGYVKVADCSFFGAGSIVKDKIEVASYNFVGAGAYLHKSTPENHAILPMLGTSYKDYAEKISMLL